MNYFVEKNKLDALKNLVIYQKNRKEKGVIFIDDTIIGLPAEKGFIYESLGNSKFSKVPISIPTGYKKMKRTKNKWNDEWALKYVLNTYFSHEDIKKLNKDGCDFDKWYKKSRKYWLTIDDVMKLKPKEKVKLLLLDRNILDNKEKFKAGILYKPEIYFKEDTAIYSKNTINDLHGKIKYKWQKSTDDAYNFGFDIEYNDDNWYPLIDGVLPAADPQGYSKLLGKEINWSEFPKKTHIGSRGPIILWKYVKNLPKIYQL